MEGGGGGRVMVVQGHLVSSTRKEERKERESRRGSCGREVEGRVREEQKGTDAKHRFGL